MGAYPALAIQQPENPVNSISRLVALKGMLQQQQTEQQLNPLRVQEAQNATQQSSLALQDAQALRQIAPNHVIKDDQGNVKGYDWNGFITDAAAAKVAPQTLQNLQKSVLETQTAAQKLTADQRANQAGAIDQAFQHLEGVRAVQDPNAKQMAYQQAISFAKQNGLDISQLPPQVPDNNGLSQIEAALGMHAQQLNDASKNAEVTKNTAQGQDAAANAQKVTLENEAMQKYGGMTQPIADAKYRALQQQIAAGQKIAPDDQNFVKAYEKQKLLVPSTVANIRIAGMQQTREYPVFDKTTGSVVMATPEEINRAKTEQPGRYTAAGYTPEAEIQKQTGKAFGPGGKGSEEVLAFNTALQHADLLKQAAAALKNGDVKALNQVGNQLGVQFGSDKATNFQVIANAYTREVTKALSAGHLTDTEIKEQGATMPASASPAQINGALDAYKSLMKSKMNLRQQQFDAGKQGQVDFGAAKSGGINVTAPDGSVHAFPDQASADKFKALAGIK